MNVNSQTLEGQIIGKTVVTNGQNNNYNNAYQGGFSCSTGPAPTTTPPPPTPQRVPTPVPAPAENCECALPGYLAGVDAERYALIAEGNADLGAHNVYEAIAIGGTLTNAQPGSGIVVKTMSTSESQFQKLEDGINILDFDFKGGYSSGTELSAAGIYFEIPTEKPWSSSTQTRMSSSHKKMDANLVLPSWLHGPGLTSRLILVLSMGSLWRRS